MRIPVIANVIGLFGVCVIVALATGCGPCPKDYVPCAGKSAHDPCSQTCNGPPAYRCIPEPIPDGPLVCKSGAPCNPSDHCEKSPPCYATTCDFSRLFSGPGVYTCTDDVCCKRTPAKGSKCPASESETGPASWTGVCDDAGLCVPPAGD